MQAEAFGNYELIRLLATGGMGEVYLARQRQLGANRAVVVKRILRHLATDPGFVEMFLNEARLSVRVAHPNVVQVYEVNRVEDTYFIAMEYVDGSSLRLMIESLRRADQHMPLPIWFALARQMLSALKAAHDREVLHRDVSPDNLLVSTTGQLKLGDFGIAKAMQTQSRTRTGWLKGKCAYLAPELLDSERFTLQADLYSAGVVLYELLTLRRPFEGASEAAVIAAVMTKQPRPPVEHRAELPEGISRFVLRAIAKEPAARFSSAGEMASAMEALAEAHGGVAAPDELASWLMALTPPPAVDTPATLQLGPAHGRPWLKVAIAATALCSMVAGVSWVMHARQPAQAPVEVAMRPVTSPEPPVEELRAPARTALLPPPEPAPQKAAVAVRASPRKPAAAPGQVVFHVKPWAEVFWKGRSQGLTPMAPLSLPAGKQKLTLVNKELGVTRSVFVTVPPGAQTTVSENLFPRRQ